MLSLTGKYVISPIDNIRYCRKNGQFLKHLRKFGYATYQEFFDDYYPKKIKHCSCGKKCSFEPHKMTYLRSCGDRSCVGKITSNVKRQFTEEQWTLQKTAFQQTMSEKPSDELLDIATRRNRTNVLKYGVEHRLQQQVSAVSLNFLQDKNWMYEQHITKQKTAVKISEELNVGITTATNWLHRHNIPIQRYRQSQVEREIIEHIKTLDSSIDVETNNRTIISPLELDLYISQYKLAIEIDGIYWHGQQQGKTQHYHLNKTKLCENNAIRLIHMWDSEWSLQPEIVKSRINNLLGYSTRIYARKCSISRLTYHQSSEFFKNNHIQGHVINMPISYGLILDDQIVACMGFSNSRYTNQFQYELTRYANILNHSVVGGASRLFTHFIKEHNPTSVVSYSDKRWNTGQLYSMMGFRHSHTSKPNYKYFVKHNPLMLHSRNKFQKHKLAKILETFNSELTEWENMINNGYDRIWDCGNEVFVWS